MSRCCFTVTPTHVDNGGRTTGLEAWHLQVVKALHCTEHAQGQNNTKANANKRLDLLG